MARPCAARSTIRRWISAFAPTSTPWVGSSRMRTEGRVASQRASATFCWLPPESVRDRRVDGRRLDARSARRTRSRAPAPARGRGTAPRGRRRAGRRASCWRRRDISSDRRRAAAGPRGRRRGRARTASAGEPMADGRAAQPQLARVGGREAEERARQLRAARSPPGRPGPTISPARTSRSTSRDARGAAAEAARRRARRRRSGPRRFGNTDVELAADHQADQVGRGRGRPRRASPRRGRRAGR